MIPDPQPNQAEPGLPTTEDVIQENANMLVPVGASLLMVEAQSVEHLMLDDLRVNTTLAAQGHRLGPPLTANKRVAPRDTEDT